LLESRFDGNEPKYRLSADFAAYLRRGN